MFLETKTHNNGSLAAVTSKILGAVAAGAGAAVLTWKALDHLRRAARTQMRRSLTPRLSTEDRDAILRMEGEGGPCCPLPRSTAT